MTYEFDGKKYREASSHQKEWGNRLIEELNISGAERILDLGCGDGTLTARLAELVPRGHVIGTDASSGMIDAAAMHRADNLSFVLKDINDLDYSDEFDVIFSNAALHWVKDHDALLANVHRALGNCGTVRFNFAADGNCRTFFQVVRKAMAHRDFERFFHDFNWPWFMPTVEEVPSATLKKATESAVIVSSTLRRCAQSAEQLSRNRAFAAEEVFCEAELPLPNRHFPRLPFWLWCVVFRLAWVCGFFANAEPLAQATERARNAAERLIELARENGSVFLVGHGIMNMLIVWQLSALGWVGPKRPANKYWQFSVYHAPT